MRIKSKKTIGIFLAVTTLVTGLFSQTPVMAESEFEIETENGKKVLVKYNGTANKVKIPEGVDVIGFDVFGDNTDIVSIKLPKSLRKIEFAAFEGCSRLKKIKLPIGLTEIETSAFLGCNNIKSIHLEKNLKKVSTGAFAGMENLKKITVSKDNKYLRIKEGVLYSKNMKKLYCYPPAMKGIKKLIIPKQVKRVGSKAFANNKYLEEVIVKQKINFEGSCFAKCESLKKIVFKKPYGAAPVFYNCKNLETVVLAEGQRVIKMFQFEKCTSLTNINLPSSLEVISFKAFKGCENLSNLEFPKGLKEIRNGAFKGCTKLEKPILPDTVEVHEKAFDNVEATDEE